MRFVMPSGVVLLSLLTLGAASAADIAGNSSVLSVVCFGSAEQIRNLCALVHFDETRIFDPIMAPWGSHCSLFVAYPSGMAANAPKNTAFLGPNAPEVAVTLNNLAGLYRAQGQYAQAEPLYQRALAIYEQAFGKNHPNLIGMMENYAALLRQMNRDASHVESRLPPAQTAPP